MLAPVGVRYGVFDGCYSKAPRRGGRRKFSAAQRPQVIALACTQPRDHAKPWVRWSSAKLAAVAVEQGIVPAIAPSTVRIWLRADRLKPCRFHNWQPSTDSQFVDKATPVLDLYQHATDLAAKGEVVVCTDEKTSIQARQRLSATTAAIPEFPVQVSDRSRRMGALQLFCALLVATGLTFILTKTGKCFSDFKQFLLAFFASVHCQTCTTVHLILDNGSTHAKKQLGEWIASFNLSDSVKIYWLPTHASWLDQVEIIFSKVQRDVLTPNDFGSTTALEKTLKAYFADLNQHPNPIHWTYTKTKFLAKFNPPQIEVEIEETQLMAGCQEAEVEIYICSGGLGIYRLPYQLPSRSHLTGNLWKTGRFESANRHTDFASQKH
ncbi:MAG: IS630 family transposase [Blastocatellia bacterium]|nr:IS630 family transposase [Blastocatellia bacterium]